MTLSRMAQRFCGLVTLGLDQLTTQRRLLLCAPTARRERPAIDRDPALFLNDLMNYLPAQVYATESGQTARGAHAIGDQLPGAVMLNQPTTLAFVSDAARYYWFEATIYARHLIVPTRPAALDPALHFRLLFAIDPQSDNRAVELMSSQLDDHWLTSSPGTQDRGAFSAGVVTTLCEQLVIPRLQVSFHNSEQLGSILPFAVAVAAVSDYRSRVSVLVEPPL